MPYKSRKVSNKNCYKVYNTKTKKVFSRCSTKENAIKQLRLLRAIKYNKEFVVLPRKTLKKQQTKRTRKG